MKLTFLLLLVIFPIYAFASVPFSENDKFLITSVYLAGFFFQMLYSAISRKLSFKDILILLGFTLLAFLMGLAPGKNESASEYNFFSHVFIGTIVAGIAATAYFKEKFSPRINEFSFLIWSMILPYLFIVGKFSLFFVLVSAVPFILAMINIYTNIDRFEKMRILFYILFIIILIIGSMLNIKASDLKFFNDQSQWYPYTASGFFLFGMLIAYVTPYVGYLYQFFRGKHESKANYLIRKEALIKSCANNFNHEENFPKIYTSVCIFIALILYVNYEYNLISVPITVTVVMVICQIIDRFLNEKPPVLNLDHPNPTIQ